MAKNPRVSILVNNFNYGRFIQEAVDSVVKQTYTDWELIIVDDGSTDSSRAIIASFLNRYPDKITAVLKPNGGQGSALNTGFSLSRGEIIAFLDSDDYWYPDKLEKIVEKHKDHDLVAHNQDRDGEYGNAAMRLYKYREEGQRFLKKYGLINWYNASTSAISCKRELLEQIFPVPEDARVCVDVYLMVGSIYYSNLYYIDECLGLYRIHGSNNFYGEKDSRRKLQTMIRYSREVLNERLKREGKPIIPDMNLKQYRILLEKEEGFQIKEGRYAIYGTGVGAERVADYVSYCGGSISFFCDSKSQKWGQKFLGKSILSPKDLVTRRQEYDKIVIGSMWIKDIKELLEELGLSQDNDFIYSKIGFWMDFNEKKEEI